MRNTTPSSSSIHGNEGPGAPPNKTHDSQPIRRVFELKADNALQLHQRLDRLRRALQAQGGYIADVAWRSRPYGKPVAKVQYVLPRLLPNGLVAPANLSRPQVYATRVERTERVA